MIVRPKPAHAVGALVCHCRTTSVARSPAILTSTPAGSIGACSAAARRPIERSLSA